MKKALGFAAAVKHLQELIAKDPVEVPKHPPYPGKKK